MTANKTKQNKQLWRGEKLNVGDLLGCYFNIELIFKL